MTAEGLDDKNNHRIAIMATGEENETLLEIIVLHVPFLSMFRHSVGGYHTRLSRG